MHQEAPRSSDAISNELLVDMRAQMLELEKRVRAADRRARRTLFAMVLLASTVVWLGAVQATGRVTETGALVIRDDNGTVRAQIGVGEEGAALGLFDERGFLRAGLAASPDGPILNLFSADGNPRVVIGERGPGSFVVLRDADGAPRAAMAIQEDGSPSLYLLDETMAPLWRQPDSGAQR